jgi:hypothetical protein
VVERVGGNIRCQAATAALRLQALNWADQAEKVPSWAW